MIIIDGGMDNMDLQVIHNIIEDIIYGDKSKKGNN